MRPTPSGISGKGRCLWGRGWRGWGWRRSSGRSRSWRRWSRVARSGGDERADVFVGSGDNADSRRYRYFLTSRHHNFAQDSVGLRFNFHRHLVGGDFQQGLALLDFLTLFY